MVVSFSSLPLGVERQALHPPSPAASSTTAAGTSEEEGLHTALFLTFSRWPSCSSPRTSEEEGLAPPPPHNVREYLGGGRTGLPPHTVGVYFMSRVEDNDEVNILYSLTYSAVTVEGDQHIMTSAGRQSDKL